MSGYSVVEDHVIIQHGVTLGASKGMENAPTIRRNAVLGAKCTIIGNVQVGENCIIGAGAIVTKDVPANHTAIGINSFHPNSADMQNTLHYFSEKQQNKLKRSKRSIDIV